MRQAAGMAYDLSRVHIVTNTLISKIVLEDRSGSQVATGVCTSDGRIYYARKEVIVSCGAFRTPQILMLSGIGASSQLKSLGVEQVVESAHVGKNLHDRKSVPVQDSPIHTKRFLRWLYVARR